jgi:hypothetical protein
MRVILSLLFLFSLVAFGLWAFKSMIHIRPKVKRPKLDESTQGMIAHLEGRLKGHVRVLSEKIGPRSIFSPEKLDEASNYIAAFWKKTGYEIGIQTFEVEGAVCRNLSVEIPGRLTPDRIILIGAHYDTVSYSPGANDNGSAVASLLELSRLFKSIGPAKTVRFVAFANEEPPFFKTRHMGSLVYAKACQEREEDIEAMVCLETIGYYRQQPGTQNYPFPLSSFYPDTGDFVAVVGNLRSRPLVVALSQYFMEATDFPVECAALFGFITGIDWSDHWSFWRCGYRAVMITDTALFRYPFYHSHEDTADKLDYGSLSRVTHGLYKALGRMAGAGVEGGEAKQRIEETETLERE